LSFIIMISFNYSVLSKLLRSYSIR
jgi:hypothetical protein